MDDTRRVEGELCRARVWSSAAGAAALVFVASTSLACASAPVPRERLSSRAISSSRSIAVERACPERNLEFLAWIDVEGERRDEEAIDAWLRSRAIPSARRIRGCDLWLSCPHVSNGLEMPTDYDARCRSAAVRIAQGLASRWRPGTASIEISKVETGWARGVCETYVITDARGRVEGSSGDCFDFGWVRVPLRWR